MSDIVQTGISYMYEPAFNRAILPLLEAGMVDALEWSFDTVTEVDTLPGWTQDLLLEFSRAGRLYGHGVYYSLFSGGWYGRHDDWFRHLEAVLHRYRFCHISEHFGFMSSGNAHEGAPLPLPFCPETLRLGIRRLQRLQAAVGVPVGIENLALAFSQQSVLQHGPFLEALVAPVNGFIVLDLHNVYCQAANFGVDALTLVRSYPLDRVRELHASGGSWEASPDAAAPVRRDTHNDAVPEAVFSLLEQTLPLCPHLAVVIFERLGDSLPGEAEEASLRADFLRVRQLVQRHAPAPKPWPFTIPATTAPAAVPPADAALERQQAVILHILKNAPDAAAAKEQLMQSPLLDASRWRPEQWDIRMIDTAMQLGKKWGIHPFGG